METLSLALPITFALTILLAACYTVTEVVSVTSGIEGQVLLGPLCPVVRDEMPCPDQGFQATVEIWTADRTEMVGKFVSDGLGHFRVSLLPGHYILVPQRPESDSPYPTASPLEATVEADAWTILTIPYDKGIR